MGGRLRHFKYITGMLHNMMHDNKDKNEAKY